MAYALLAVLGCGPDAKRDNPLDPVNGRGVYGTVRNSAAAVVPGAVVTARPVNINAVCDAQGAYSLDLEGGQRYVLSVRHPQYYETADTVDVPSDGKLEKDFILAGKPTLSGARVNTYVIAHENGKTDRGLKLECLGTHPEGCEYLDGYFIYAMVENKSYPANIGAAALLSRAYTWDLDLEVIYGISSDPETLVAWAVGLVGKPVSFSIVPGEGLASLQSFVPLFSSVPTNLTPNNGTVLTLPGTLSWTNAIASGVNITVEIWQGTQLKWSLTTAGVSSVNCNDTLVPGAYTWLVRTTDSYGNTAASEATFIIP